MAVLPSLLVRAIGPAERMPFVSTSVYVNISVLPEILIDALNRGLGTAIEYTSIDGQMKLVERLFPPLTRSSLDAVRPMTVKF